MESVVLHTASPPSPQTRRTSCNLSRVPDVATFRQLPYLQTLNSFPCNPSLQALPSAFIVQALQKDVLFCQRRDVPQAHAVRLEAKTHLLGKLSTHADVAKLFNVTKSNLRTNSPGISITTKSPLEILGLSFEHKNNCRIHDVV